MTTQHQRKFAMLAKATHISDQLQVRFGEDVIWTRPDDDYFEFRLVRVDVPYRVSVDFLTAVSTAELVVLAFAGLEASRARYDTNKPKQSYLHGALIRALDMHVPMRAPWSVAYAVDRDAIVATPGGVGGPTVNVSGCVSRTLTLDDLAEHINTSVNNATVKKPEQTSHPKIDALIRSLDLQAPTRAPWSYSEFIERDSVEIRPAGPNPVCVVVTGPSLRSLVPDKLAVWVNEEVNEKQKLKTEKNPLSGEPYWVSEQLSAVVAMLDQKRPDVGSWMWSRPENAPWAEISPCSGSFCHVRIDIKRVYQASSVEELANWVLKEADAQLPESPPSPPAPSRNMLKEFLVREANAAIAEYKAHRERDTRRCGKMRFAFENFVGKDGTTRPGLNFKDEEIIAPASRLESVPAVGYSAKKPTSVGWDPYDV